ncbi:hypothetical protein [Nostoc sp.]
MGEMREVGEMREMREMGGQGRILEQVSSLSLPNAQCPMPHAPCPIIKCKS